MFTSFISSSNFLCLSIKQVSWKLFIYIIRRIRIYYSSFLYFLWTTNWPKAPLSSPAPLDFLEHCILLQMIFHASSQRYQVIILHVKYTHPSFSYNLFCFFPQIIMTEATSTPSCYQLNHRSLTVALACHLERCTIAEWKSTLVTLRGLLSSFSMIPYSSQFSGYLPLNIHGKNPTNTQ